MDYQSHRLVSLGSVLKYFYHKSPIKPMGGGGGGLIFISSMFEGNLMENGWGIIESRGLL